MNFFRTRKSLLQVINSLEDENKNLKYELEILKNNNSILVANDNVQTEKIKELNNRNDFLSADNVKLLENARELRAKIRGLENILEHYAETERLENKPKRRGRPKKES